MTYPSEHPRTNAVMVLLDRQVLAILAALRDGPMRFNDLRDASAVNANQLTKKVLKLIDEKLVKTMQVGDFQHYSLTPAGVGHSHLYYEFVKSVEGVDV